MVGMCSVLDGWHCCPRAVQCPLSPAVCESFLSITFLWTVWKCITRLCWPLGLSVGSHMRHLTGKPLHISRLFSQQILLGVGYEHFFILWLSIIKLCSPRDLHWSLLYFFGGGNQPTFCTKECTINTFGFAIHDVFGTTAVFCCCDTKAAARNCGGKWISTVMVE